MSDLCKQCRHRKLADKTVRRGLSAPGAAPSVQREINRINSELLAERSQEDLALRSEGRGTTALKRRPMLHDWCAIQGAPSEGMYFFCDWLKAPWCEHFQCAKEVAGCQRCECATPDAICQIGLSAAPETRQASAATQPPPITKKRRTSSISSTAALPASPIPTVAEWSLPLGASYGLQAVSRTLDRAALGPGSFQIEFEPVELDSNEPPAIRGEGLKQTYLIFGGPGAGKTHYFKYLLSSLLAHKSSPGCLLLDPKGALTAWLEHELKKLRKEDKLTVLEANADKNAFNLLGQDLPPKEIGRLISEVVLAGAEGVDEGWAVLVGDLLEAAAVIIAADDSVRLTAKRLLRDILYRSKFRYRDGKQMKQYPIVIRAQKMARKSKDVEIRIACDRIDDYFSTTEPKQRRFVRQMIERSLAELTLPQWQYLSDSTSNGSVYSDIITNGRIVSVAVGQSSPAFQRSLSTLIKALFQQAVLAHLSRRGKSDATPFFILACDEYAQAITEGQTGLVSDSRFFSLSREAGCLSLLALQSVATGRSRFPVSMHDRWEGILGNVTVKIFMKLNDTETAEMASALVGSQHSFVQVLSQQQSAQGLSATNSLTMLEHPRVPAWYLTNRMRRGHALVHGTLDGESMPTTTFVKTPSKW